MLKVIFFIVFSLIFISGCEKRTPEESLKKATELRSEGDIKEALKYYIDACDGNISLACKTLSGLYRFTLQDLELAEKYLSKACESNDSDSCHWVSEDFHRSGNFKMEQKYLEKSCSLGKISDCAIAGSMYTCTDDDIKDCTQSFSVFAPDHSSKGQELQYNRTL